MTQTPATAPSSVLIVDDNTENRLLLSSQLRMEGYEILQAKSGIEGIELARQFDPDIILLDVMMPEMSGFEVCSRLKQDTATHLIPIIMVTALRDVQYRIKGIEVGADEFLSRPHVREELMVRVRTLIQLKRARVGLEEERNRLQLLYDISRAISTQLNLDSMMAEIITQTQKAVGATKGNIMLFDDDGQVTRKFLIRAGLPLEVAHAVSQDVMHRGLGAWLVSQNRAVIIEDISQDERWLTLPDDASSSGSAIGVPLSRSNRTVGILILFHPTIGYFTNEHLTLLQTIGAQVTAAIENAYLFADVSEERRKLEAILAQSNDAVIITDEEWLVSLFNQTAEKFFQVDAEEVVGQSIRTIVGLDNLAVLVERNGGHAEPQEIVLENGRTLYASISAIQEVGFAAVFQDVTEIRRAEALKFEQERREKQQVKEVFSRYLSPKIVDFVLANEPRLLSTRERRRAVIMFADLRNSTGGLITKVEPNEAIEQLNEFFTSMMDIALANDGTIFELTGDEILVGFNAPFDQPNAPYLAVKTAISMQEKINQLRQAWYRKLGTEVGLGIGIDQGDVVIGNVGAESRLSFRMVGEPINRASRLVNLADDGQIVISNGVYSRLAQSAPDMLESVHFEAMEPVILRGILEPQTLYCSQVARTPLDSETEQEAT